MLKKIAAFMVLLTMVFAFQTNVWAAAVHAEDVVNTQAEQVIRLEENPQLEMLNEFQIAQGGGTGFSGMKIEPWFWILSIPISGLGQFLMGETMRGLLFFLAPIVIGIAWSVIAGFITAGALAGGGIGAIGWLGTVSLIVYVLVGAIWVWNVIDAYMLNQSKTGMASLEDRMKLAAEMQEKMASLASFVENNQFVAYENGFGYSRRLATF